MGGTFDPIHHAHLFVAEEARILFGLDRVLFIPNGIPVHKTDRSTSPAHHRLAMTALAVRANTAFECSSIEIERSGPSYTVETLLEIRRMYPGAALHFITGTDAVAEIQTWVRHREVIALTEFIVAERPGCSFADLRHRLPAEYWQKMRTLPSSPLDIGSTGIRCRVREGRAYRYLVPDAVADYIRAEGLYRAE